METLNLAISSTLSSNHQRNFDMGSNPDRHLPVSGNISPWLHHQYPQCYMYPFSNKCMLKVMKRTV